MSKLVLVGATRKPQTKKAVIPTTAKREKKEAAATAKKVAKKKQPILTAPVKKLSKEKKAKLKAEWWRETVRSFQEKYPDAFADDMQALIMDAELRTILVKRDGTYVDRIYTAAGEITDAELKAHCKREKIAWSAKAGDYRITLRIKDTMIKE